ncbi:toxin-antitoxin system YwqK family antitoxin [Altibacter sp. HG106]|uniref:toxin-antitoxin system YwqK family antitoxin n=1 Tax=Altibacter sp. HG106 TaxID=3023937 RepID=UPI002350249E|nr:hypothetical protein [Altibacter sp. HG106]MDC7993988.1 hypothetical protein [Altibacter sp. HG106]
MLRTFILILVVLGMVPGHAQEDINQVDDQGRRHGVWKKYFDNSKQLRYEGTFEHGSEVGTFKFYCETCKEQPMVVKEFTGKDNLAKVTYFTENGKKVSEGTMSGKLRTGEWVFYHKASEAIMSKEHYREGTLHGRKITYYPNGQVTEELSYEMGSREGENLYYSPEGVLLKKLLYFQDELHGPATYYDANGNVVIDGHYKEGKKHGLWKYYKNGEIELEERYPKPTKG